MSDLSRELAAIARANLSFGREDFEVDGFNQAAVLALFRGPTFLESEILLILRSANLVQNPGQVALPGGGLEAQDHNDLIRTALRETFEEVGIAAEFIQTYGILPPLPTVTGNFIVNAVLGSLKLDPVPRLNLQATEVAHAEWMPVKTLIASRETETRMVRGVEMKLPIFHWNENRMWGLTAMIFDLICRRYDKLFS